MIKVRGVYDGERVRLLEALDIPPNTEVEVLIPESRSDATAGEESGEPHWQRLIEAGLIKDRPHPEEIDDSFEPIPNPGEPISDTITRERR